MRVALPLTVLLLSVVSGCATGGTARAGDASLDQECRRADPIEHIEIKSAGDKAVTVCAVGSGEDCLYTEVFGKTFRYASPDLNADGRADAVIQDFSGAYGQHDVVRFMAFAQCGDGTFLKVINDMLQNVSVATAPRTNGWVALDVTRTCFNETLGVGQTRNFLLTFDPVRFRYGPPDNDPELAEFCSAKEVLLPRTTPARH